MVATVRRDLAITVGVLGEHGAEAVQLALDLRVNLLHFDVNLLGRGRRLLKVRLLLSCITLLLFRGVLNFTVLVLLSCAICLHRDDHRRKQVRHKEDRQTTREGAVALERVCVK